MISIYSYSFLALAIAFADAATQYGRCVGNICFTEWAMSRYYGIYCYVVAVGAGIASVGIYFFAVIAMIVSFNLGLFLIAGGWELILTYFRK